MEKYVIEMMETGYVDGFYSESHGLENIKKLWENRFPEFTFVIHPTLSNRNIPDSQHLPSLYASGELEKLVKPNKKYTEY